jgi:hypothetical protein
MFVKAFISIVIFVTGFLIVCCISIIIARIIFGKDGVKKFNERIIGKNEQKPSSMSKTAIIIICIIAIMILASISTHNPSYSNSMMSVTNSSATYSGTEIVVGSIRISIPVLDGFIDVTKTRPDLVDFFKETTPPENRFQALFVPPEDTQLHVLELNRHLTVQTLRSLESQTITSSEFSEVSQLARNQMKEILDEAKTETTQHLSKYIEQGLEMNYEEIIYVPFDSESENHFAFSFISKATYGFKSEKKKMVVVKIMRTEKMCGL